MLLCHADCCSLVLVTDDFFATLVEVDIEKDHLLDAGHIKNSLQVKVYLVTSAHELIDWQLTRF